MSLFDGLSDAEAKAIVSVLLSNADFDDDDFTDRINRAIDVCYRVAAEMQDRGYDGLSERTLNAISLRRAQGQLPAASLTPSSEGAPK